MIAKFNTSKEGDNDNTMLYLLGAAILVYVAYTYVIKPEMDKKKVQQAN